MQIGPGDEEIYMGGVMVNKCPFCQKRVQDYQMAWSDATIIYGKLVHRSCLVGLKPSEVERMRLKLITEVKDV